MHRLFGLRWEDIDKALSQKEAISTPANNLREAFLEHDIPLGPLSWEPCDWLPASKRGELTPDRCICWMDVQSKDCPVHGK